MPKGNVVIVTKEPQFLRDVGPYFAQPIMLIAVFIYYLNGGNLCKAVWVLFMACPLCNLFLPEDNANLSRHSEKAYLHDKRFWIPQYAIAFMETIVWIWALILMSDQVSIESSLFSVKPTTSFEYFMFTFVFGYFTGINIVVGHELLHKKEWYNKAIGTWCYTKFMSSHFIDEHIKGHHKRIATPEDSATSRKNESF